MSWWERRMRGCIWRKMGESRFLEILSGVAAVEDSLAMMGFDVMGLIVV
jgi:hypothetical protein